MVIKLSKKRNGSNRFASNERRQRSSRRSYYFTRIHKMKWLKKKKHIFSTHAVGLLGTTINEFSIFDTEHGTEARSCGEIFLLEPPDAAVFCKHAFIISWRRFILTTVFEKRSHCNSTPSGGRTVCTYVSIFKSASALTYITILASSCSAG